MTEAGASATPELGAGATPAPGADATAVLGAGATVVLEGALALSRELLAAADRGDVASLTELDAQRLRLLKSLRLRSQQMDTADRVLLQQIAQLNDRALGAMEHHRRSKGRALDMAAVGRRALAAYSTTRQR